MQGAVIAILSCISVKHSLSKKQQHSFVYSRVWLIFAKWCKTIKIIWPWISSKQIHPKYAQILLHWDNKTKVFVLLGVVVVVVSADVVVGGV